MSDKPRTHLPDFCSLPVVSTLVLLAALVVLIMQLAPSSQPGFDQLGVAMLLAVWVALLISACLCLLRKPLQRLSLVGTYGLIWLLIVLIVALCCAVVWWLDQRLMMGLIATSGGRFVVANVCVAALVGAALLRYFYVLAQWRDGVRAASQAQVEALQARIRPHFLFNSMNTVAALVRLDPDAAERTVENLSELFRAALGSDRQPATLGQELDLVDRYLAIEQLRLGDRLHVERALQDAPRDLALPRLLLQPIVENAVHHGIHACPDGGTVSLHATREGRILHLDIDNSRNAETTTKHQGHGHALDNVRHRLDYHSRGRATLHIVESADRYRVRITLPLAESKP